MWVGAVGGEGAVGFQEGLDVVAYEDAGVQQGEGAVEERFVVDGVEESRGQACRAQCVESASVAGCGFIWGGAR